MRINISDTSAKESVVVNEAKNFFVINHRDPPQFFQFNNSRFSPPHMAKRDFTDYERMSQDTPLLQQLQHDFVGRVKMINPDG